MREGRAGTVRLYGPEGRAVMAYGLGAAAWTLSGLASGRETQAGALSWRTFDTDNEHRAS